MGPDTVDAEKQEPESASVNSRNKIMGAAALAVLLIVGVSVVAWHFTKQERKLLLKYIPNVRFMSVGQRVECRNWC